MTNTRSTPIAAVVGVGPGLGAAIAARFAREGFHVATMARTLETLRELEPEITRDGGRAKPFEVDATDPGSVESAFAAVREQLGDPTVLVYNAGAFRMGGVLDLDAADFERCWRANCLGGFLSAQQVLPAMVEAGAGSVLFTGATASLRGSAKFSALAVGKFGLRALAQSMARELGPRGVHVAHIVVDGQIGTPRQLGARGERGVETFLDADALADVYWQLHTQDRTVWTHELDVRPFCESF